MRSLPIALSLLLLSFSPARAKAAKSALDTPPGLCPTYHYEQ
jgi:hypothetical protein